MLGAVLDYGASSSPSIAHRAKKGGNTERKHSQISVSSSSFCLKKLSHPCGCPQSLLSSCHTSVASHNRCFQPLSVTTAGKKYECTKRNSQYSAMLSFLRPDLLLLRRGFLDMMLSASLCEDSEEMVDETDMALPLLCAAAPTPPRAWILVSCGSRPS